MKIIIHNLLNETNQVFEGDVTTVERELENDFAWAVEGAEGDLDHILSIIDHHPYFGVEVADHSLHPFLKE
jgi:hypothetical protein